MRLLKSGELRRINIFEGSVRSGKTYISMIMWAFWVAGSPKDKSYLMSGKTLTTLKRNVLEPLKGMLGDQFSFNVTKKEGELFGRRIYLEGAANAEAESKIRGMTLMGAYCDELTLFGEEFFVMLLSRLSENGAKLFATTNPDTPSHWVKRDYLDRESVDLLSIKFTLEDNIFLPEKYIAALKKPINTRINMLNRLIATKRFFVSDECPHVIEALNGAVWDERDLHKDVRLDDGTSNIDSLDALEYAFERFERQLFGF